MHLYFKSHNIIIRVFHSDFRLHYVLSIQHLSSSPASLSYVEYCHSTCGHPLVLLARAARNHGDNQCSWPCSLAPRYSLVSAYNEKAEGSQVSLLRYINLGDGTKEKRKYNVPLVNTQDVETLCQCILEFEDVLAPPRLSLTTGPLKFSFFRQCLGGTICDQWDTLADGLNETWRTVLMFKTI